MDGIGTSDYYTENATQFAAATCELDLSDIYSRFLPLVTDGGHILDAGCGSGRDALCFHDAGFEVTAFDACPKLAEIASAALRKPVRVMEFMDLEAQLEYDAIWCSASLLHAPMEDLPAVFERMVRALKHDGVWYMSFKVGDGPRIDKDARYFWDFNPDSIKQFLARFAELSILDLWTEPSRLLDRDEEWLNVIVRRA